MAKICLLWKTCEEKCNEKNPHEHNGKCELRPAYTCPSCFSMEITKCKTCGKDYVPLLDMTSSDECGKCWVKRHTGGRK